MSTATARNAPGAHESYDPWFFAKIAPVASKAAPPPGRFFAGVAETVVVLLLAMTFLTVNFLTASRSPTAWGDETCMVDPSVSLVLGQGFKSAAWYAQSKEEVWAGYAPLHPLLLGQWLKVVGFSMGKTRSMNYVLVLAAALLLWGASARLGLIAGAWARLALVALVFSGYGITFVYRSGRIDSLHIFLTAAFVFACSLRTAWLRAVLLAFIGIATSLAGYQLIAYAAILVPLAWLFVGRTFWPNAASFVLGGTAGMLLLLGYYTAVGALEKMQTIVGQFFLRIGFPTGYLDYSFLLLSAIALIFALREKAAQRFRWRSPLGFGLVAAVAAPLGVSILGRYPIYYSWMAWLPLAFGFCAAIAAPGVLNRTWERVGATLVVFVVCTIGLPARIALTVLQWNERDYAPVQALAARTVTKADWVYADYPAYYAVKPLAGLTILPPYRNIISDDEKRRVTCLVIRPEDFREVSQILGGKWADTGEAISPVPGRRSFGAVKYNLRVWRRAGT